MTNGTVKNLDFLYYIDRYLLKRQRKMKGEAMQSDA